MTTVLATITLRGCPKCNGSRAVLLGMAPVLSVRCECPACGFQWTQSDDETKRQISAKTTGRIAGRECPRWAPKIADIDRR